jgi:[pyruvate, water dikinase]-phosphate phosphotransferase / [pyruvate, water dikinase] kinase
MKSGEEIMTKKRTVFFISDGTGITAENLGKSLLTQFEQIPFEEVTVPYVDNVEKARQVVERINQTYEKEGLRPILFSTLANNELHKILATSQGLLLDFFQNYIEQLENELKITASHSIGKAHALDSSAYNTRIEAMNYALGNDDGLNTHNYNKADIILVGVSRSAKTPTCLYMALQYGIYAANYPFTEEDLDHLGLPSFLLPIKDRLFGLTIDAHRLHTIRTERRPNSRYASLDQCQKEVRMVENLFKKENIPYISTTSRSIEEIATIIINNKNLKRRLAK